MLFLEAPRLLNNQYVCYGTAARSVSVLYTLLLTSEHNYISTISLLRVQMMIITTIIMYHRSHYITMNIMCISWSKQKMNGGYYI